MNDRTYAERIKALQQLQTANNVACVALMPGANLRYFTGVTSHLSERPMLGLIPAEGQPALILPALEAPAAQAHLPADFTLYPYRDEEGHEHAFFEAGEALSLEEKTIGVEYLAMRLLESRRLEQAAPGCVLMAVEPWLPKLRMAKDDKEVAFTRKAVAIAETAMQSLLDEGTIRAGRT
ncbi:MAG: aminopeptidase P family N-terminal domain-containing protein, partial [Anaerolineae bacterium]